LIPDAIRSFDQGAITATQVFKRIIGFARGVISKEDCIINFNLGE
jgi:hypothetical protein